MTSYAPDIAFQILWEDLIVPIVHINKLRRGATNMFQFSLHISPKESDHNIWTLFLTDTIEILFPHTHFMCAVLSI